MASTRDRSDPQGKISDAPQPRRCSRTVAALAWPFVVWASGMAVWAWSKRVFPLGDLARTVLHLEVQNRTEIPHTLVLNAKEESLLSLKDDLRRNVIGLLSLSREFRVRFLSSGHDCETFIGNHFDAELLIVLDNQTRGAARSDVCRIAVLYREGGFYVDLDVQLAEPLQSLVDPNTTFSTAIAQDISLGYGVGFVFAKPQSAILREAVSLLRRVNRGEAESIKGPFGPEVLLKALKAFANKTCPHKAFPRAAVRSFVCGDEVITLHQELGLNCSQPSLGCTPARARSQFGGVKLAFFDAAGKLMGWPRYADCDGYGCGQPLMNKP